MRYFFLADRRKLSYARPILRLRLLNNWIDCELINHNYIQIVSLEEKQVIFPTKLQTNLFRSYSLILRELRKKKPNISKFRTELRSIGKQLRSTLDYVFKQFDLKPTELDGLALALDDSSVKIPWELTLTSERPIMHLCETTRVGRMRVVRSEEWEDTKNQRKKPRALVVGINYEDCRKNLDILDFPEEEAARISSILNGHDVTVECLLGKQATKKRIIKILKKGVDIFHFTGHGSMKKEISSLYAYDEDLIAKDLEEYLEYAVAPYLTFVNACETAVERSTITDTKWESYTWANALTNLGGRAFIGTLWPVWDEDSSVFSECFYKELFSINKRTLAESVRLARKKVAKKCGKDAILTWPSYVLYGPPWLLKENLFSGVHLE